MDDLQKIRELCDVIVFGPRTYTAYLVTEPAGVLIGLGRIVVAPADLETEGILMFFIYFRPGRTATLEFRNSGEVVRVSVPVSHPVRYGEQVRRFPMEALAASGAESDERNP